MYILVNGSVFGASKLFSSGLFQIILNILSIHPSFTPSPDNKIFTLPEIQKIFIVILTVSITNLSFVKMMVYDSLLPVFLDLSNFCLESGDGEGMDIISRFYLFFFILNIIYY
jgi:hypothetical protein